MTRSSRVAAVAVLAAAASSYSVLQSLVVPVLATLQHALRTGPVGASWIFTTYLLTASVFTPLIGRLGDLYGRARALSAALLALSVGSVVSAAASSLPVMIAGRVVQGAGGAVFPLAFALVRDVVPAPRRAAAMAVVSAALTVTGSLGTVLGGVILATLDPHWLFWFPAGLTALTALASWAVLRRADASDRRGAARRPVGWRGAALLAAWLGLLLSAISAVPQYGLLSWPVVGAAAAAVPVAGGWAAVELRAADPLVDVRLMSTPAMRGVNGATVLLGAGMFSAWMLVPMLALQPPSTGVGLGLTPGVVGLLMLANAAGTLVVTPLVPVLARRAGTRSPVVVGAAVAALAYALLAVWHGSVAALCCGLVLEGCGIGSAFSGIANLVVGAAPADRTGVATGVNTICRTVGGAVGTTAVGALLTGSAPASAFTLAFAGFAGALALSALAARSIPAGVTDDVTTLDHGRYVAPAPALVPSGSPMDPPRPG